MLLIKQDLLLLTVLVQLCSEFLQVYQGAKSTQERHTSADWDSFYAP